MMFNYLITYIKKIRHEQYPQPLFSPDPDHRDDIFSIRHEELFNFISSPRPLPRYRLNNTDRIIIDSGFYYYPSPFGVNFTTTWWNPNINASATGMFLENFQTSVLMMSYFA